MFLALLGAAACTETRTIEADPGPSPADDDGADTDTADTAPDTADTGDTAAGDTAAPPPAPCAAFAEPVDAATVDDAALAEISGLVVSTQNQDLLWVLQDQGHDATLTALDLSGATRGTIALEGVENVDWEALAAGPCGNATCLYVGDIGDNERAREGVSILRVPEPAVDAYSSFALTAVPEVQQVVYPAGSHFNAEGLASTPDGHPVIVTKQDDGTAGVFYLPTWDPTTTVELVEVGWIETGPADGGRAVAATAADLTDDGSLLLVRTYSEVRAYPVDGATIGAPTTLPTADERQGETVAWDPIRRGFWQIGEDPNPTMWFAGCAE